MISWDNDNDADEEWIGSGDTSLSIPALSVDWCEVIAMEELTAASEIGGWDARLLISSIAISPLLTMITEGEYEEMIGTGVRSG